MSFREMPEDVRHRVAGVAQDAYHYFLAAGGNKLGERYGESAFADWRNNTLKKRIEHLSSGFEKLTEMAEECRLYLSKGARFETPSSFTVDYVETIEELDKQARRGLKLVVALARRFGVDARQGRLIGQTPNPWAQEKYHFSRRRK